MNYLNIIELLYEGLEPYEHPHESIAFFKKDKVSMLLWLLVLRFHYQKKDCNTESIFLNISPHFASRPTIYKHIDAAISKGHIFKKQNEKDHRIFNLYPSEVTINEFEEWANKFTHIH